MNDGLNDMLNLWWADPSLAAQYRPDLLQAADTERADVSRSPRAEQDWRVSRALLQQARPVGADGGQPALSLSHSRGHAVVAAAPSGWSVGVDLEAIRPRDVERLAPWCCSGDEQEALRRCDDEARRQRAFYLLWTLKEAFIKAANLSFPADMRSVGLAPDVASWSGDGSAVAAAAYGRGKGEVWAGWRLRAPREGWRAYAAVVEDAWLVSVVWRWSDSAGQQRQPSAASRNGAPGARYTQAGNIPRWHVARGARVPGIVTAGHWP